MNELSEFFSSVAKEKKKVEEEKIRFTPRVNVDLSDLSSFFGTITEAKREHVVIAKRDSTKFVSEKTSSSIKSDASHWSRRETQ